MLCLPIDVTHRPLAPTGEVAKLSQQFEFGAAPLNTLTEVKALLLLATPVALAQLAQTAIGFVDTLMAGHYGATDLAAIALGSGIWLPIFLSTQGLLMATTPLVAHLVGADNLNDTRQPLYQGALFAALLAIGSVMILRNCSPLLAWLGTTPELAALTDEYLKAISWGFPALLFYQLLRCYVEGFGQTRPAMKIALLGLLANIPMNYLLIFGKLGAPELGGEGCGWASAVVMWLMLLAQLIYLRRSALFAPLKLWQSFQVPAVGDALHFLRLGLPIGAALLIEVSMFSLIALLLADQGEHQVGAHQITLSFTGLIFMLPLSLSLAMTIRVGHLLGQRSGDAARFSARCGLLISLCIAASASLLIALNHQHIAALYTDNRQIIQISSSLLLVAAVFQFPDAIQITCSGILRGYKDTALPLMLVFIAYWLIGLPLGYTLAKTTTLTNSPLGPLGFWIGLLGGLSIGAILLLWRYIWISKRRFV